MDQSNRMEIKFEKAGGEEKRASEGAREEEA